MTDAPAYPFFAQLAQVINSGQARSILMYGEVHDLRHVSQPGEPHGTYLPLLDYLTTKCRIDGIIVLVYELNGPLRFLSGDDRQKMQDAWIAWQSGQDPNQMLFHGLAEKGLRAQYDSLKNEFNRNLHDAIGQPTVALELLRQLTLLARAKADNGRSYLPENLLIFIEAADMLLPAGDGDIGRLNPADRHRVSITQDWFCDPGFLNGDDAVVLLSESRSLVHQRVVGLPQVLSVEVPSPTEADRLHYIHWFIEWSKRTHKQHEPRLEQSPEVMARLTAGLSIHALRQLLIGAAHTGKPVGFKDAVSQVERFITRSLGEDVIEFSKPSHRLDDVVGFTRLKQFMQRELIPRIKSEGADALPGAAVAGAIGSGKTFLFEALAAELDLPVLVLKNIRSQWYGQTDVIFERLRRVLESLGKVILFVDEADTQFGGVGEESQATERRLTGKIQQMMSDTRLRGKVVWLLMTARIHLLSPDIRRPGRVGDLIIPVLDPRGEDRRAFLRWTLAPVLAGEPSPAQLTAFDELTEGYSAAAFASLRSTLKAQLIIAQRGAAEAGQARPDHLTHEAIEAIVHDQLTADIGPTRRYQELQALLNCTRRSLLPDPDVTDADREAWAQEIRSLEARGIR